MGFVFDNCTSQDLLVQQRSGWSGSRGRLRREDCEFVKHDKLFSNWKVTLLSPNSNPSVEFWFWGMQTLISHFLGCCRSCAQRLVFFFWVM
jgi:hypothetical protein